MKKTVLVVDDDKHACELAKMYLEDEYNVEVLHEGTGVMAKIKACKPVLVVLDIMLPGKNGWEICRDIRREMDIPIVMLSAKGEEIDKVLGLELGADDYITKPFSPRELAARIKAVLRRTRPARKNEEFLRFPGLVLNLYSHQVMVNDNLVELTPKEFELLRLLAANPGKVFTREELLDKVWGYDYFGDARAVDSQVKRLRKKLETFSDSGSYIDTVWGVGYKFEVKK